MSGVGKHTCESPLSIVDRLITAVDVIEAIADVVGVHRGAAYVGVWLWALGSSLKRCMSFVLRRSRLAISRLAGRGKLDSLSQPTVGWQVGVCRWICLTLFCMPGRSLVVGRIAVVGAIGIRRSIMRSRRRVLNLLVRILKFGGRMNGDPPGTFCCGTGIQKTVCPCPYWFPVALRQ